MKNISFKSILLLTLLSMLSFSVYGQDIAEITARFSNPRYDKAENFYYLDVEFMSDSPEQYLFGVNTRFFYDASMLKFEGFSQIADGYTLMGESPTPFVGNEKSGLVMFNFSESAAYVNSAIQLKESSSQGRLINKRDWTRFFTLKFKLTERALEDDVFCPCVIWDLKNNPGRGGYFPSEDGLVLTVINKDPLSKNETRPVLSAARQFNWEQFYDSGASPFGVPRPESCIKLKDSTSPSNPNNLIPIRPEEYKLYQNYPNPFDDSTIIGFQLPKSNSVKINVFDTRGKLIRTFHGDYTKGYNYMKISKKDLGMPSANLFMYQMEADGYISEMLKMISVNY